MPHSWRQDRSRPPLQSGNRESGHQTRNASASGLHFHRHGDRILVILNHKYQWQLQIGNCVHGLPEFTFAGGPVTERNVGDFVAVELDVFELSIVAFDFFGGVRMSSEITGYFSAAHRLQDLSSS